MIWFLTSFLFLIPISGFASSICERALREHLDDRVQLQVLVERGLVSLDEQHVLLEKENWKVLNSLLDRDVIDKSTHKRWIDSFFFITEFPRRGPALALPSGRLGFVIYESETSDSRDRVLQLVDLTTDRTVAQLEYLVGNSDPRTIYISMMTTRKAYRGRKLQDELFQMMLLKHPQTLELEAGLAYSNTLDLNDKTELEALDQIPLTKILKPLGFELQVKSRLWMNSSHPTYWIKARRR